MGTTQYFAAYAQKGLQLLSGSEAAFRGSIGANEEAILFQNNPIYSVTNGVALFSDTHTVQALHDLDTAIANINSRPVVFEFSSLNGRTFTLGVYTYTGSSDLFLSHNETMILDGGGDPNAVWIFRINQKVYFHGNVQIINLPGYPGDGKQPVPVWWHVYAAELEFSPTVIGNILSDLYIHIHSGGDGVTSVSGSLLSLSYIYIDSGVVLSCQANTYPSMYFGTYEPTAIPSQLPSSTPSVRPSAPPSVRPSTVPSVEPSMSPTAVPSISLTPSEAPSLAPSAAPSISMSPTAPTIGK
jgi:hypothetical protein